MADSEAIEEPVVLPEIEILKKAVLDETSPSDLYKDTSPVVGAKKPEAQIVEEVPSATPTPLEKIIDDEVMITGTHQGSPPAKTMLAKVVDSKEQVKSRSREVTSEKYSLEDLYK